jgi:signal transduction histidine kinase
LVDARSVLVLLSRDGALRVAESAGEVPAGLRGTVVERDEALLEVLRTAASQRRPAAAVRFLSELGIDADVVLLVPLRARGEGSGAIAAVDRLGGSQFSADDELVLSSFGAAAAAAIAATQAVETEKLELSIAASEHERGRWARELHDDTLQELGALKVMHESALRTDDAEAMRAALRSATEHVERMIGGLEGLITELRPAALDQLGIQAAIEGLVATIAARHPLQIEVDFDLAYEGGREPERPSPELEATVYRIVQEALRNVIKHAAAQLVRVAITENESEIRVIVEDDGKGLEPSAERQGFGLIGMRERVSLAGGELTIGPGSSAGTRVTASLPAVRRGAGADA